MNDPDRAEATPTTAAPARRRNWTLAALLLGALALAASLLAGRGGDNRTPQGAAHTTAAPAAVSTAVPEGSEVAILAGGCFWCVEADFDKLPGVLSTTSGYTGGSVANPSYEQVSAKTTGHAEVVKIVFDPKRVSYTQLLAHFWRTIDPTTVDRQFCDAGSPYRSAIFAVGAEQLAAAQASLAELNKTKPFAEPVVTQVLPAGAFYPAEDYHQDYYLKNPVRYSYYRSNCGRDLRLQQLWGAQAIKH